MLHVVHDVAVQVAQDGDTRVHLVVDSQTQTHAHVLADVQPVQVVPEALADPVLADLSTTTLGECVSQPQEYSCRVWCLLCQTETAGAEESLAGS